MSDFKFLKNPSTGRFVILDPKRASRPKETDVSEPVCPFEPIRQAQGKPGVEASLFEIGEARVIPNKYPFAPIHEIVIHSNDHEKNFDTLDLSKVEDVFKIYRARYLEHESAGQVYIFHNYGRAAGESLPHPHSQITVTPDEVTLNIPKLALTNEEMIERKGLYIFCPNASEWPNEVWVAPKRGGRSFGEITDEELEELSATVSRLIQILRINFGEDFAFNFYIYPGSDWYLRIIPRVRILGGFETGTGVFVNTKDPKETFEEIKRQMS